MRIKLLPKHPYGLVAFAEALFGITIDVGVLLRASFVAATYTTDAYFAILSGASQSPEGAKRLRHRRVKQLRQRSRDPSLIKAEEARYGYGTFLLSEEGWTRHQ